MNIKKEGKGPAQGKELYVNNCTPHARKMELGKVEQYLRDLPGWKLRQVGKHFLIERRLEFDTFEAAEEFSAKFDAIVHAQDHHPEGMVRVIEEVGKKPVVPLQFWTHSAGGITLNDLIMAAKASHLLEEMLKK